MPCSHEVSFAWKRNYSFKSHLLLGRILIFGLAGWPRLEVRTLASKLSSMGLIPDSAINCHPGGFTGKGDPSMCVSSLGWMLNWRLVCQHLLVDVKDPMVSFMKSRQAIAGTMAKFQISALTSRTRPGQPVCEDFGQASPGWFHKRGGCKWRRGGRRRRRILI